MNNNKIYFFKQKIFGGKAFDFLIVKIQESQEYKCLIYAFQVSVFKKNIFNKNEIINIYYSMIEYLSVYYDLPEPRQLYFGYIFDSRRKDSKEYESMLKKCEINNMKYCFYNIEKELFENFNGFGILKIENALGLIISETKKKYYQTEKKAGSSMKSFLYFLTDDYKKQINKIKEILELNGAKGNNFKLKKGQIFEPNLLTINKCFIQECDVNKYILIIIYYRNDEMNNQILKFNIIEQEGNLLDYDFNNSNYKIKLNGNFDVLILS